jgi:hypothetical protein
MDDIYMSIPYACGESDCPAQWHIMHVWHYDDGTWSQCDADGNHDPIDESDVPTLAEHDAAWLDYARHVAATGTDPLGNYYVRRTVKRREAWRFAFARSIAGAVLLRARRGGRDVSPCDLPAHVRVYLALADNGRTLAVSVDELKAANVPVNGRWHRATLEHETPRPAARVAAELRRAARRHIRAANNPRKEGT